MKTLYEEGNFKFPLGVSVEIEKWGNSKYVTILARLHVNKRYELPHSYSDSYSNAQILRDGDFLKYLARYR